MKEHQWPVGASSTRMKIILGVLFECSESYQVAEFYRFLGEVIRKGAGTEDMPPLMQEAEVYIDQCFPKATWATHLRQPKQPKQ